MDTNTNGKILNFLYHTQNRRRINPLYGIFTKIGLFYALAGYVIFVEWEKGTTAFVLYLMAGMYIYKNNLNYRFYQQDRLYFYHLIITYLGNREPVPVYEKIVNFLTEKVNFRSVR